MEILEEMALSEREVLIEKILENLNLYHMFTMFTKVNKEAYESLLYLIINLTALEESVVSKLIQLGLLECLAIPLKSGNENYRDLLPKISCILSNIASDSQENIDKLLKSSAFEEAIGLGIIGDLMLRFNIVQMMTNLICHGSKEIVVELVR